MKIAIAVSPQFPCPPVDYAGNPMQADILARKLVARGHNVILLCGPNSTSPVCRIGASSPTTEAEWEYVSWLRGNVEKWDCVWDMTASHLISQDCGLPKGSSTIAHMLGDPHRLYPHDTVRNRVYCSYQLADFYGCPAHPVLHNIISYDPDSIPIGDGSGGYALYIGTIRPEKGIDVAARACRRLGLCLKVGGEIQKRFRPYWQSFEDIVDFIGPVPCGDKWKLFGEASVFMLPINWCDAGPLVVMESLLVGTPVIACPVGGLLDDVVDGENGFLCPREEFATTLDRTLQISWNRESIRAGILPKIDPDRYVDTVESLCKVVVKGKRW